MKRLAILALAVVLSAHDLAENRATLVLRDRVHLSLSLYLNYAEALHRALLPQREYTAFLLTFSAMNLQDLERELNRAHARFQSDTAVLQNGIRLPLTHWNWPAAKDVQTMLQRQVMQAMTGGHVHEPPTEIRAEAVAPQQIESLSVRFPSEFQRVLVVSYKPNQTWAEGAAPSADIRF